MPKSKLGPKEGYICTRVTLALRELIFEEAQDEGLTASEWLRDLIVNELKEREVFPKSYPLQKRPAANSTEKPLILKS